MYCFSCGTAVTAGLSYCNRCGAEVGPKERSANKLSELSPGLLVCAIVVVTIGGLGAIITLLMVLKESPEFAGVIMAFSMLSVLIVLATEIVFIWMLLRRTRVTKEAGDTERLKEQATKELSAARERLLPEPLPSITEHTTRTLEPMSSQGKAE
jgi:hypothetical protein